MATLYYKPFSDDNTKDDLPSANAIEDILPDYKYIFVDPHQKRKGKKGKTRGAADDQPGTSDASPPQAEETPRRLDQTTFAVDFDLSQNPALRDLHLSQQSLLDHQMRELEQYRKAVHRMGQDILIMRDSAQRSEEDQGRLRERLSDYEDPTRLLSDKLDLDNMSKTELVEKILQLKRKLRSQTSDLAASRDESTALKAEMMKKSDQGQRYDEMEKAHAAQARLLQKYQVEPNMVDKLKKACRQQEEVIVKMEKVLSSKTAAKKDKTSEAQNAVIAENARLRKEVNELKNQPSVGPSGSRHPEDRVDEDRLRLYEHVERQEARIISLERQLTENSRHWGKEKGELLIKLNEYQHGFSRSRDPLPQRHHGHSLPPVSDSSAPDYGRSRGTRHYSVPSRNV